MSLFLSFKKISSIALPAALICLTTSSYSDSFMQQGHSYFGLEYGKSFATLGNKAPSISYDQNNLTDSYPINTSHAPTDIAAIKGGYEFIGLGAKPAISLGLGLYRALGGNHYSGQVNETALGGATNTLYNDQFTVSSMRLMAETKFTWSLAHHVMPFAEAGVGPTWNRFSDYSETPATSDGYVALPGFQSHTTTRFAYQVGVGLGYAFNVKNLNADGLGPQPDRVAVGYRYADLGQVESGVRDASYPYSLQLGRLKTNDVYLNFTHLF